MKSTTSDFMFDLYYDFILSPIKTITEGNLSKG